MTHAPAISGASSIDPGNHPDPLAFDRPGTSLGLRCAIAIRPSAIFSQKSRKVFQKNRGMNANSGVPLQTHLLEHSGATRYALFAVTSQIAPVSADWQKREPAPRMNDRGPPIRDYFQKPKSDLTKSSSQGLGGTRKRTAFPLGRTMSVIGGNSDVSALREFFAV